MKLYNQDIVSLRPLNNTWIHSEVGYKICKYAYHKTENSYSPDIKRNANNTIWNEILNNLDTNFTEDIRNNIYEIIKSRFTDFIWKI